MAPDTSKLKFEVHGSPKWFDFLIEIAKQGNDIYLRKRDSNVVYRRVTDKEWNCTNCDEIIMVINRIHSVYDGPDDLSGRSTKLEQVPYCPKCEEEPSSYGSSITPRNLLEALFL
ncbi:MAG: hypothetical protein AABX84_00850 [Nanoarchaeota archaeon]